MNKEELRNRKKEKESVIEYTYMVKDGHGELNKHEYKIKAVYDNGFEIKDPNYALSKTFDCFGKWECVHSSINCHTCRIYLTQDENIDDYLSSVKEIIVNKLRQDIEKIEKSLQVVLKS